MGLGRIAGEIAMKTLGNDREVVDMSAILASQSIPTSNQIISWLKEMESFRKLLPEVSGLPPVMGIESEWIIPYLIGITALRHCVALKLLRFIPRSSHAILRNLGPARTLLRDR